jgi:hypothetical protein
MRAPALQLLTARRLNDYRLPRGWLPVAAINPAAGGYECDELDPALESRFARVEVVADRREWLAWARAHGTHPAVVAYAEADATIFDRPDCGPRSWAYVSDVVRAAEATAADQDSLRGAVAGLVGTRRAAAFLRILDGQERPLSVEEILDYPRHRTTFRGWVEAGRLDLVQASLKALLEHLAGWREYQRARRDGAAWPGIVALLEDLPGDLRDGAVGVFRSRGQANPLRRREALP